MDSPTSFQVGGMCYSSLWQAVAVYASALPPVQTTVGGVPSLCVPGVTGPEGPALQYTCTSLANGSMTGHLMGVYTPPPCGLLEEEIIFALSWGVVSIWAAVWCVRRFLAKAAT